MKPIILLIILFSVSSFAQQPVCDENGNPITDLASNLAIPNCLNKDRYESGDKETTCQQCATEFAQKYPGTIKPATKEELQKKFTEAALKEYKKNITHNLVEAIKLTALPSTGADFKKSIEQCKMMDEKDFAKGCKSPTGLKLLKESTLFKNLNIETSNELAKILSDDPSFKPKPTLLERSNPSCHISEKELLYLTSATIEEAITPQLMDTLKKIDPKKFRSTFDVFLSDEFADAYDGDASELYTSLKNHPFLNQYFKNPESIVTLFSSIKSPASTANLREFIYSKKAGTDVDQNLANACQKSFQSLRDSICSPEFENGNFSINPYDTFNKIAGYSDGESIKPLADSEEVINKNLEFVKFCPTSTASRKLNLSSSLDSISTNLDTNYKTVNLEIFNSRKYQFEFSSVNELICRGKDKGCSDQTFSCTLIKKYKALGDKSSLDAKLASSSNKDVNQLLRSMIGDTTNIDRKTKDVLIAQGIIPKDDGTMVVQADIPERKPEIFAKDQSQQQANGATVSSKAASSTNVARSATGRTPASESSYQDDGYSNANTKSSSNTLPDFSDLMDDQQELKGIQDEIKRRLLGLPENKPTNINEAKKIARDSFKSRGKKISPEQEDAFASRMMQQPDYTVQNMANSNSQLPNANAENRAQVSGGESAQAKWRKGQDQAALMGMKGAQDVLNRDPANAQGAENKPKDMTKVALNLADDPRVTLSDMFNKKIDQNDPETQLLKVLLKNKNNFLLQVKSMNFKIIFDEKNNFNLLLESGDRQEAARIRPQLEMFLKKLKT